MRSKALISMVAIFAVHFAAIGQDDLSLRDALSNKTWYAIKVITEPSDISSWATEFACSDEKPYLFSLTANHNTLKRNFGNYGTFPRELKLEPYKIFYERAKIDSTIERVYFKVNFYSEDFLDISDDRHNRYLMISDYVHSY